MKDMEELFGDIKMRAVGEGGCNLVSKRMGRVPGNNYINKHHQSHYHT